MNLFIWKLSQKVNNGYDTYSDAVVVSRSAESAQKIHPSTDDETGEMMYHHVEDKWLWKGDNSEMGAGCWADPKDIQVTCVGLASDWLGEGAVVCSSFHAG